jgi:hypothetical protein
MFDDSKIQFSFRCSKLDYKLINSVITTEQELDNTTHIGNAREFVLFLCRKYFVYKDIEVVNNTQKDDNTIELDFLREQNNTLIERVNILTAELSAEKNKVDNNLITPPTKVDNDKPLLDNDKPLLDNKQPKPDNIVPIYWCGLRLN